MSPRQTTQISDPPHGGKASLESVMLHVTEEEKLGDGNIASLQKWISSQIVEVNKLLKPNHMQ